MTSLLCFWGCVTNIISTYIFTKNSPKYYDKLISYRNKLSETKSDNLNEFKEFTDNSEAKEQDSFLYILKQQNSDLIGWLSIEDTNIDYPVVKTNNNDYYLNHDFWNKYSLCGTPFMDFENNISSYNMVIYGHNMKNGTMFSELKKFKDTNFYTKNSIIIFKTQKEIRDYKLVSILLIDTSNFDLSSFTSISTKEDKEDFLKVITTQSLISINKPVSINDSFITLCTCDTNNTRLFVIAKKI